MRHALTQPIIRVDAQYNLFMFSFRSKNIHIDSSIVLYTFIYISIRVDFVRSRQSVRQKRLFNFSNKTYIYYVGVQTNDAIQQQMACLFIEIISLTRTEHV